jgi:hypothetical protein
MVFIIKELKQILILEYSNNEKLLFIYDFTVSW